MCDRRDHIDLDGDSKVFDGPDQRWLYGEAERRFPDIDAATWQPSVQLPDYNRFHPFQGLDLRPAGLSDSDNEFAMAAAGPTRQRMQRPLMDNRRQGEESWG